MASSSATEVLYQRVMEEAGFYRNGVPTSGVLEAESLRNDNHQLEKRLKYSAVIDPDQINATAVFELSGSPCIYFTQLDSEPNPKELARLHKLSWNHGLAPMLWVVTPTNVRLYNCYSKPTQNNPDEDKSILIDLFENTEASLRQLNEHASRLQLETGEFWKWQNARQIDRKKRVDRVLVEDLRATEKLLRANGLDAEVAHALLMKSIFVAYLEDRGILDSRFFQSHFGFNRFVDVLEDVSAVKKLFEWLKITFNGDMFSISSSGLKDSYDTRHLTIVKNLVCGRVEVDTGQGRLWREYDFKVIPVELISSIYENFLYSKDSKSAEETSVHYTPINLVDLVLEEIFEKLNGSAKILDLACGSGIFLVESLRRLVMKRCQRGDNPSRKLVRDTLYNQIYGVDISPQAIQIAAFSLYLTALELDAELEESRNLSTDLKFQPLIDRNLFACDAFDENAAFNDAPALANKEIDAIIGNPPWTKSRLTKSASIYCKRKRVTLESLDTLIFWWKWYAGLRKEQILTNEQDRVLLFSFLYHTVFGKTEFPLSYGSPPDQAFLWRTNDFCNSQTQIGLILHGRAFFSNFPEARVAKKALLSHFKPRIIINLSKLYRERLFPNSEAPAIVLIAGSPISKSNQACFFVCPQRSADYKRHGILEISSKDVKKLSLSSLISDCDTLKVATWGGARDFALIQKLRKKFPSIEEVAENSFKNGFKVGDLSNEVPEDIQGMKWLPSGQMKKYKIDPSTLEYLPYEKLEAPRSYSSYKAPLVIVPEKVESTGIFSAFSSEDIVYTKSYYGLSISSVNPEYLSHYLNAILNSSLANYFLFMTASSWGVSRKTLLKQDLARLPIPHPDEDNAHKISQIIDLERLLIEEDQETLAHADLKNQLNRNIYSLYDLDEAEQTLVEDAVCVTIDFYMNREESKVLCRPLASDLKLYSITLISAIQPFLETLSERVLVADVIQTDQAPLQVIKFSFLSMPGREHIVQTTQVQELGTVLDRIAGQLPQQISDQIYTRRDLRIYSGKDIYIVKPAQKRYWGRSVGLNDADLIISEHLRVNRAAIG